MAVLDSPNGAGPGLHGTGRMVCPRCAGMVRREEAHFLRRNIHRRLTPPRPGPDRSEGGRVHRKGEVRLSTLRSRREVYDPLHRNGQMGEYTLHSTDVLYAESNFLVTLALLSGDVVPGGSCFSYETRASYRGLLVKQGQRCTEPRTERFFFSGESVKDLVEVESCLLIVKIQGLNVVFIFALCLLDALGCFLPGVISGVKAMSSSLYF